MYVGIANPRWRGKPSRLSQSMHTPRFYVSGKRPMVQMFQVSIFHKTKCDKTLYTVGYSQQHIQELFPTLTWPLYCKLKKAHFFKVRLINPFFTIKTENTKSFLRGLLYNPFIYNGRTGGVPVLYHNSLVTVACKSTVYCYHEERTPLVIQEILATLHLNHHSDATRVSWRLKPDAIRLFVQLIVQANNNVNMRLYISEDFWGEPPEAGGFPSHRVSDAENVSMSWRCSD